MKEKRPLKYLYIISACMVIVLCGWLCYKYIKVNQSLKESDNDKSNISLVEDKSGANRPVLAEGMIPVIYNEKKCGDLDDPTEEKYPGCYEYTIDNITETDWEGMLNDMCVGKWKYALKSCTIFINNIKKDANGNYDVNNLDYWTRSYISYGFTMKSKKTFLKDNVINSTLIKADNTNNNWYDYENKMWANAVMVKTEKRDKYMNAKVGTEIKEDDVLAYYVWIPRYKYQLFNAEYKKPIMSDDFITCVDNCLEEQLIEVIFESGTNTTGETRCQVSEIGVETCTNKENGKWYTHPAFTFGDTELKGLWVGKFETSGNATTPTIKPNMTSLTNQNVSTQFITSQKFNSTNYLTKNGTKQTDAHMMKNIEWGAVAYLKQSKYGLGNTDMGMNNYYYCDKYGDDKDSVYCESPVYHKTGCGDKANREETSFCNAYYTVRGRMASTTGNITGVYDMSGGTDEYVMGVIQDNDTTKRSPMSGKKEKIGDGIEESYSGYVGKIGIILEWDKIDYVDSGNTLAFPNLKYYDLYANDTSDSYYAGSHLGDATGETEGWYNDYSHFISFRGPWFCRGLATFNYRQSTGIFAFGANGGGASDYFTFRSVLSITK